VPLDAFGNRIDPAVGYARGAILRDSLDETRRRNRAIGIAHSRLRRLGDKALFDFTGSPCDFPLDHNDAGLSLRELPGHARIGSRLVRHAREHFHASEQAGVAVFNRTSAAIIAAILALAKPGDNLIAVSRSAPSHPSVHRGAALAGAVCHDVSGVSALEAALNSGAGSLVIVTGVSSDLDCLDAVAFSQAVHLARSAGRTVLVDDAYGARVRPILLGQEHALDAGADLVVTSTQKAGLGGPRAGLMAGHGGLLEVVASRASEMGMEARAPLAVSVLRALERFGPDMLRAESSVGERLASRSMAIFGEACVENTLLGPRITADSILNAALDRAGIARADAPVVPVEASAALGMLLIEQHGVITVNATGMPGARPTVRLRSSDGELRRLGGDDAFASALDDAVNRLAGVIPDTAAVRAVLLGNES